MATQRVLQLTAAGKLTEYVAAVASAGAATAGQLVATDNNGKLDITLFPAGLGADTATMVASEALAAGAFVNVWNNAGVASVRNADGSAGANGGKQADGFVLASAASGATVLVYFQGINTAVTGQTAGLVFLSATTPGGSSSTGPTAAGTTFHQIGMAISPTAIQFDPEVFIVRA